MGLCAGPNSVLMAAMINIPNILEHLQSHYDDAVATLRSDVIAFGRDGAVPPARKREDGSYAHPQLTLH